MPTQRLMPSPEIDTSNDISNSIYKAAANIRAGQQSRAEIDRMDAETNKLKAASSPENQNYLLQEKEAELAKKQTDAKTGALELHKKRLSVIKDVDEFSQALPHLTKDLSVFGEEGAKELMPRVAFKPDASGQKQIPDNDAFLKEKARIVDALSKMDSPKVGDKITWTEDVKDEATGKMKTVDVTKVYGQDGAWTTHQATTGGIKTDKAPEVKNFQVGDKEIPHQWDEAKQDWVPVKGKGGPKWNPKEGKPDMTEPQAREKLFQLTKWESQLEKTGGVDEFLFTMIAKDNPELADKMQGADKTEAKAFLKEQKAYYEGFTKKSKATATKGSGSGATHTYVPGKGLVLKDSKGQK